MIKKMFKCKSSFHGNIDEIPFISVDNFDNIDRCAYFLSHYHSDHTSGLFENDLYNNLSEKNAFIYTSEVTAKIIGNEDIKLSQHVRSLKLGTNTVTVNIGGINEAFTVILLPAGHCFGSVMFLFKINDKTVLYTGDFRLSGNTVNKMGHFHSPSGDPIVIDTMYVDTTFQRVRNFPTRQETVESAVTEIKKWIGSSDQHYVALHTSAGYGYEFVFKEIYKQLGLKVKVDDHKWNVYSQFKDLSASVTTDHRTTRIHVCKNRKEYDNHEACVPHPAEVIFMYIHFSAMRWSDYDETEIFLKKKSNRIDVCFATHCSRSELLNFIKYLSPKRVVGFPDAFVDSPVRKAVAAVKDDRRYSVSPKRRRLCFAEAKVGRKVDVELLKKMFE